MHRKVQAGETIEIVIDHNYPAKIVFSEPTMVHKYDIIEVNKDYFVVVGFEGNKIGVYESSKFNVIEKK